MSENVLIAVISMAGMVIGALIAAFGRIFASERSSNRSQTSCGLLGLTASFGALIGLVLGAVFGIVLIQSSVVPVTETSRESTTSIVRVATATSMVSDSVGGSRTTSPGKSSTTSQVAEDAPTGFDSAREECPLIVIEGSVGGLPIRQTKTWSELEQQGTTREPISAQLDRVCSRDPDNEVQMWIGYWSQDPGYLDFRKTMTAEDALALARQNIQQPIIIVPWGE